MLTWHLRCQSTDASSLQCIISMLPLSLSPHLTLPPVLKRNHKHSYPMASASAITMAMPSAGPIRALARSNAFFNPMRVPSQAAVPLSRPCRRRLTVQASSMKEKAVSGLVAAAMVAALVVPDIAEAAQPGLSPSLKNFLVSIVSGGVVLVGLLGAVIGVSNFDPVKRT